MLVYIVTLLIPLFVTLFYFKYVKVLRKMRKYAKQLEESGYKVCMLPYNPFGMPTFYMIINGSKTGDPYEVFKTKFEGIDVIVSNVFQNPAINFLSPEARKQFARNETDFAYQKVPFLVKMKAEVLGYGLIFNQGQQWKRKRHIFSSFFTYEFINKQIPEIAKICQRCLQEAEEESINKLTKKQETVKQFQFSFFEIGSRIFSSVILTIFLGCECLEQTIDGEKIHNFVIKIITDFGARTNQKQALLFGTKILNLGLNARDRDILRRVRLLNQWVSQYIDKVVAKYNQNPNQNQNSLLYLLLQAKKEKNIQQNYTKAELIDEFKVFFFAGTDTTSHFLQMMLYYTAQNAEILKKARQETLTIDKIVLSEDVKKLKYFQALQKQTVRYYGPIPINFPRIAVKDHYINGVLIHKGTSIQYHATCTHYDPKYYQNPFEFRPERWLQQNKQFDSACLTGFGMGSRTCIGQYLAYVESKIALYTILKRYSQITVPPNVRLVFRFMTEADDLVVKVVKK